MSDTGQPGDLSQFVEQLVGSLEQIMDTMHEQAAGMGPAKHPRRRQSDPPQDRLAGMAAGIAQLAAPARAVMQPVFREICAQLSQVQQLSQQLETLSLETRRAAHLADQSSITDALTGLLNRRGFNRHARALIERARAASAPVVLVFADLDGMKQVNDQLGHQAGDEVLKATAQALRQSFRSMDLIARWGGDEFVVLCTNHSAPTADIEKRLQAQLAHGGKDHATPVSLSFGVVQQPADAEFSVTRMIETADGKMYASKRERKLARLQATPPPTLSLVPNRRHARRGA